MISNYKNRGYDSSIEFTKNNNSSSNKATNSIYASSISFDPSLIDRNLDNSQTSGSSTADFENNTRLDVRSVSLENISRQNSVKEIQMDSNLSNKSKDSRTSTQAYNDNVPFVNRGLIDDDDELDNNINIKVADRMILGDSKIQGIEGESEEKLKKMILSFQPVEVPLGVKLAPFLPDYAPAVGEADPFIKIPRPDNQADYCGLAVMDEPNFKQSDPTLLHLELENITGLSSQIAQPYSIEETAKKDGSIETSIESKIKDYLRISKSNDDSVKLAIAEKSREIIEKWILQLEAMHDKQSVNELTCTLQPPEDPLAVWPVEVEEALKQNELPNAEIDLTVREFFQVACTILGIPYTGSDKLIESLYMFVINYMDVVENVEKMKIAMNTGEGGY